MRLPTVFYYHLVKAAWLVELVWYTNSKCEMVPNSGTKSSHMSWSREARTGISGIWQRTWSCVPAWCKCIWFNLLWTRKACQCFFCFLALLNTHKSWTPSHWLFHDIIKCFRDAFSPYFPHFSPLIPSPSLTPSILSLHVYLSVLFMTSSLVA